MSDYISHKTLYIGKGGSVSGDTLYLQGQSYSVKNRTIHIKNVRISFDTNRKPIYTKGVVDVWMRNPRTGDLDYYSNKLHSSQIESSVNMNPLQAGIGNPTVIQIPDTANITLTLTAADISLAEKALETGGTVSYNGIIPVMEGIVAIGTQLKVSKKPVAAYGFSSAFAFIDNSGVAYTVDTDTGVIQNFAATEGRTYCVRYFTNAASAMELRIDSVFNPSVETVMMRFPAYTTQGQNDSSSTHCGDYYIWIPRMQFGASKTTDNEQTEYTQNQIVGTALPYDDAVSFGACDDGEYYSALAYYVYMPISGGSNPVEGIVVVGGNVTVHVGQSIQLPVKYVVNGELIQPHYSDLTYSSSSSGIARIAARSGVVHGVSVGTCILSVTLGTQGLKTTCLCTVLP